MVPTVAVSVDVLETDGTAVVGATVTARMTGYDIYLNQVVDRILESAVTDGTGHAVLNLFPNVLGTKGTAYVFEIVHPSGRRILKTAAQVPNGACTLAGIAGNVGAVEAAVPVALSALTGVGIVVKRQVNDYALRTLTGTANQITITNGNGDTGNPTFSTPQNIHAGASPTFSALMLTTALTVAAVGVNEFFVGSGGGKLRASATLAWTNSEDATGTSDVILVRDGNANLLAMKNGTSPNELRIYGTTTGPKYLSLKHDGTNGVLNANSGNITITPAVVMSSTLGVSGVASFSGNRIDISGDSSPSGTKLALGSNVSGSAYQWIQSFASTPLKINPLGNNVLIGSVPTVTVTDAVGVAITGTLSATGALAQGNWTINSATGSIVNTAASTSQKLIQVANTGNGGFYMGVESSVSAAFFAGSLAYESVLYSTGNNIFVNTPVLRVGSAATVGTTIGVGPNGAAVSNAYISAISGSSGALGNSIEFGHPNNAGYRSTLGARATGGEPFLALNAEAGSTANTFRTRGVKGSVFTSDLAGGWVFKTIPTASADNQAGTDVMTLTTAGALTPIGDVTVANGKVLQFGDSGAANGLKIGVTGAGNDAFIHQVNASFLSIKTSANEQVRIAHTASATRYITLTGSNGGAPTIGTGGGGALNLTGQALGSSGTQIGIGTALNIAGRTGTFDANSLNAISGWSDSDTLEISAASTSGYVSGMSMTGVGATLFSGTVRFVTASVERGRFTSGGYFKASNNAAYTGVTGAFHEVYQSSDAGQVAFYIGHNGATAANQFGAVVRLYGDPNSTGNYFLRCEGGAAGATERATIRANGGLANFSANNVNLSDRTMKNVLGVPSAQRALFRALEIETGGYIGGADHDLMFFTAQQVQTVYPELVTPFDSQGKLGIREHGIQMRAYKVIQELDADLIDLSGKLAAIDARLLGVERRVLQ